MLKIGFYGHSICSNASPGTYIRNVIDHFNAKLVNKGTGRGSEERILFEVKKSNPDVAIIFHSQPKYLFVPNFPRDIDVSEDVIIKESEEMAASKFNSTDLNDKLSMWSDDERRKKSIDSFPDCAALFKKHLYHPDLQMNRFHGALMMLDDYCLNKVPLVFHIPVFKYIPSWFNFKSGIVLADLEQYVIKKDRPLTVPNGISDEDSLTVTNTLINVITEELDKIPNYMGRSRVVHAPASNTGDGGSNPPPMPL